MVLWYLDDSPCSSPPVSLSVFLLILGTMTTMAVMRSAKQPKQLLQNYLSTYPSVCHHCMSVSQSVGQSVSQLVGWTLTNRLTEWVTDWTSQSVSQSARDSVLVRHSVTRQPVCLFVVHKCMKLINCWRKRKPLSTSKSTNQLLNSLMWWQYASQQVCLSVGPPSCPYIDLHVLISILCAESYP